MSPTFLIASLVGVPEGVGSSWAIGTPASRRAGERVSAVIRRDHLHANIRARRAPLTSRSPTTSGRRGELVKSIRSRHPRWSRTDCELAGDTPRDRARSPHRDRIAPPAPPAARPSADQAAIRPSSRCAIASFPAHSGRCGAPLDCEESARSGLCVCAGNLTARKLKPVMGPRKRLFRWPALARSARAATYP